MSCYYLVVQIPLTRNRQPLPQLGLIVDKVVGGEKKDKWEKLLELNLLHINTFDGCMLVFIILFMGKF